VNLSASFERSRQAVKWAEIALFVLAVGLSVAACYQVATGKVDYSWAWNAEDARPRQWSLTFLKAAAPIILVAGWIFPAIEFSLAALALGVYVTACFNGHPGESLALVLLALFALVAAYVQKSVHDFIAWLATRLHRPREKQLHPVTSNGAPSDPADRAPMFAAQRPKRTFGDLAGMSDLKAKLLEAGRASLSRGPEASNGVLLYGDPGNGKTVFAEALAGELKVGLVSLSVADVVSKWIGQTPEQLAAAFRSAEQQAPCVLLLDEVDSLITDRTSDGGTQDSLRTTNVFLTEVVRVRGKGVVVVAATNFLERLDPAAIREGRFDFKIEITPPDEPARVGLLQDGLKQSASGVHVADDVLHAVAKRWVGFSVSRLLAITKEAGKLAREQAKRSLSFDDLMTSLRRVQGRKNRVAESTKPLAELTMPPTQRHALQGIAQRLKAAFETESLGGSLPDGVLFWGPPGTGKTEAARALAKETGWAFLATSGNDLIADPKAIDTLYRQAQEARPAIIFIDEADDVLGARGYSQVRSVTNKLLTVMDGVGGKIPDIVFIAATNHPSTMDAAALRGGRFGEKIEFTPPEAAGLASFVHTWLTGKGWVIVEGEQAAATLMDGQTIATAQAVLQGAVNLAIAEARRAGQPVGRTMTLQHLRTAAETISPDFG
jgi:transitional endoplasmic reticulum ATPase